jgi:hypothetical protein
MIQLIDLILEKGNTYIGAPEYIHYSWIFIIAFLFIVMLVFTSLLNLFRKCLN